MSYFDDMASASGESEWERQDRERAEAEYALRIEMERLSPAEEFVAIARAAADRLNAKLAGDPTADARFMNRLEKIEAEAA